MTNNEKNKKQKGKDFFLMKSTDLLFDLREQIKPKGTANLQQWMKLCYNHFQIELITKIKKRNFKSGSEVTPRTQVS